MKQVKQRKETSSGREGRGRGRRGDHCDPNEEGTKAKRSARKPPAKASSDQSVPRVEESSPTPGEAVTNGTPTSDERDLILAEQVYLNQLSQECQSLRSKLDRQIDFHLQSIGHNPERGNARQRQFRELSWSFPSDVASLPKDFEILPCALNPSEVYQFTHFIRAFLYCVKRGRFIARESISVSALVVKARDLMQAYEARKALYEVLLKSSTLPEVKEVKRGPTHTMDDVWVALTELKTLVQSLINHK